MKKKLHLTILFPDSQYLWNMKKLTLKYLDLPTLKLNTERIDFFFFCSTKVLCSLNWKKKKNEEQCLYSLIVGKELLSSKLSNHSYWGYGLKYVLLIIARLKVS